MKTYWVYILTNRSGTLYIGVTNDLARRMAEHKAGVHPKGFTARYALDRLYHEAHPPSATPSRGRSSSRPGGA